jgi:hypothetical protein
MKGKLYIHKLLVLILIMFVPQYVSAKSGLSVEPIVGYERVQKLAPTPLIMELML